MQKSPSRSERDSNMELLRIIAMSMILIYHFASRDQSIDFDHIGMHWECSFVVYGVNLFILISGYYGINLRWKSFLSLLITIFYFHIINIAGHIAFNLRFLHHMPDWSISDYASHFTHPTAPYWFISCYIALMLLAPFLNIALKSMNRGQLSGITLILTAYSILGGFSMENSLDGGYAVASFIILYVIGYYIRNIGLLHNIRWEWLVLIFIFCSIANHVELWKYVFDAEVARIYSSRYNNIFVFCGSIAFFLLFQRLKFHNNVVNKIAGSALGCYLLQDNSCGRELARIFLIGFSLDHSPALTIALYAGCFIAFWLTSWGLTWFKNLWAPQLMNWIIRMIPQRMKQQIW